MVRNESGAMAQDVSVIMRADRRRVPRQASSAQPELRLLTL